MVHELHAALKGMYTFEVSSAYNIVPKGKRKPTEYAVYAQVEDKKKPTRTGKPIRIIAGRKVPTVVHGRKVTTKELNRQLPSFLSQYGAGSYGQATTSREGLGISPTTSNSASRSQKKAESAQMLRQGRYLTY